MFLRKFKIIFTILPFLFTSAWCATTRGENLLLHNINSNEYISRGGIVTGIDKSKRIIFVDNVGYFCKLNHCEIKTEAGVVKKFEQIEAGAKVRFDSVKSSQKDIESAVFIWIK